MISNDASLKTVFRNHNYVNDRFCFVLADGYRHKSIVFSKNRFLIFSMYIYLTATLVVGLHRLFVLFCTNCHSALTHA